MTRRKKGGIAVSVRECLKQLNPEMILSDVHGERHKVRTWHRYIENAVLNHNGDLGSDIYNNGRIQLNARIPLGNGSTAYYFCLYQVPLSDFVKRHLGLDRKKG